MRYLTRDVRASVAILYPVCRWLSSRKRVSFAELDVALRPESIVPGRDPNALVSTIRVGEDIGLLERFGAERTPVERADWALEESARNGRAEWYDDPARFRILVRRRLLAKAADEIAEGKVPSDVSVGLAWLLAQDPARPLPQKFDGGWHDRGSPERVLKDEKLKAKYLDTEEQWTAFHRWAVALGCATYSKVGRTGLLVPDPTAALAEELPLIPKAGLPAKDFCDAVIIELPVLGGGRVANFMYEEQGEYVDPYASVPIGPAFSFALRRLEASGVIGLRVEHDSSHRVNGVLHGQSWVLDQVTVGSRDGRD